MKALQLFNRMGLSMPEDATYQARARRFAGFYMAEDPDAPNYDPKLKIIRSMQNGSRGPMLRKATALDWVGDPFDVSRSTPSTANPRSSSSWRITRNTPTSSATTS